MYIDDQSIGKDVWFDYLNVENYQSEVLEEDHYYPFGLTLNTTQMSTGVNANPYKYQGIPLEKHFGLETYETFNRILDPQLGIFRQIDPKAEKHYDFSPYVSMGDNPVKNVDPLGDDWFVNNVDGSVVYVKGVSGVEGNGVALMNVGINVPEQYESLE